MVSLSEVPNSNISFSIFCKQHATATEKRKAKGGESSTSKKVTKIMTANQLMEAGKVGKGVKVIACQWLWWQIYSVAIYKGSQPIQ
jgi:hypothetical protein